MDTAGTMDPTQTIMSILQNMQATNARLVQELERILQDSSRRPGPDPTTSAPWQLPPFAPFDRQVEPWTCYIARLEQHFTAYGVSGEPQRRAFLLAQAGPAVYQLVKQLHPDEEPELLSYAQIKASLSDYFDSQIHVAAARHKFFTCHKAPHETYREWITRLQGLSRDCKFACTNTICQKSYSSVLVRDMLLVHTPDETLRHDLLKLRDPSLDACLPIIRAYEQSLRTVGSVQEPALVFSNHQAPSRRQQIIRPSLSTGTTQRDPRRQPLPSCKFCFIRHPRHLCKFRKARCSACGKKGHQADVCRSSHKMDVDLTHDAASVSEAGTDGHEVALVQALLPPSPHKMFLEVRINDQEVQLQIDTGSAVTIINWPTYEKLGSPPLHPFNTKLRSFTNDVISVEGAFTARVQYGQQTISARILVVASLTTTNILGLDVFHGLGMEIHDTTPAVRNITHQELTEHFRNQFPLVFTPSTEGVKDFEASISLLPHAVPKFCKARPVPYALRDKVRQELQRLQDEGIISPVTHSRWATPIVLAPKPNGAIRICGDFKHTINSQSIADSYPIPKIEDIVAKLAGGKLFAKIDLKDAYLQLPLDAGTKEKLVINTPFGLYRYNRLPFGISSAPAIFQRYLEQLIQHIPGTANYLDDILVTGRTKSELLKTLSEVFQVFHHANLKCNIEKCLFGVPQVEYLGHIFSASGIKPTPAHIDALRKLAPPKDTSQLKSVLGQINYYRKFIPHAAAIAEPLHRLLRKGVPWQWSSQCDQAFKSLKNALLQTTCLCAYDPSKPLVLAADASDYGVGAVLSHIVNGIERPIAFVSKTLTPAQKNYSQIEKEALAIVFGIKKFHDYLYGRRFTIQTDHKPLLPLLKASAPIPTRTARRLQRWALFLASYTYEIQYRSAAQHANADFMSRLPASDDPTFDEDPVVCCHLDDDATDALSQLPLDAKLVQQQTAQDEVLSKVLRFIKLGWPGNRRQLQHPDLKAYWDRRHELSTLHGVVLLQGENGITRVVVPTSLQKKALKLLHQGHWGVVLTKQLARRHLYWRGMDRDIADTVAGCTTCQQNQAAPPQKFFPWPSSTKPWSRLHIDYAGPFLGYSWLIVVDSASGFPFVSQMSSTTSAATIQALARIFSMEGLPDAIVSDNGPQFTSEEFETFCKINGITLIHTAPFHPASNGQAERFVRTFKTQMSKLTRHHSLSAALSLFLSSYRGQPKEGGSPAERLHGRQPRSALSLLHPTDSPVAQPTQQKTRFQVQQKVWVNVYTRGRPRWLPGVIARAKGRAMYEVTCAGGATHQRHQNQLRPRREDAPLQPSPSPTPTSVTDDITWQDIRPPVTDRRTSTTPGRSTPAIPMDVDSRPVSPPPGSEAMELSDDDCLHLGVSVLGGEDCRDARPRNKTTRTHGKEERCQSRVNNCGRFEHRATILPADGARGHNAVPRNARPFPPPAGAFVAASRTKLQRGGR